MIAVVMAICIMVVMLATGAAMDFARGVSTNHSMQDAADAAALAAASMDGDATQSDQMAMAEKIFANNYSKKFSDTVTPVVSFGDQTITVDAGTNMPTTFMAAAKVDKLPVSVSATAWRGPRDPICVLSLDPSGAAALNIRGQSKLKLQNCAGQTNSDHSEALRQEGVSTATADSFCSAGGFSGTKFTPKPMTNCWKAEDPLKGLAVPTSYGCDYLNKVYKKDTFVASPGTYCGGINIEAQGNVTFSPGLYIIENGEFRIAAQTVAKGNGVTFYLVGNNTKVTIVSGSDVDLVAPTSGDYAGILFAQDPDSNPGETNVIEGNAGITLVGALYFPTQILNVSSDSPFGANSPLMPLIAWRIDFSGTSTTTIRFDPSLLGGGINMPMPTTHPSPRLIN